MTTFNTGNPIGSVDPRDLYDNAENLDTAVNTKTDTTWTDRLGVERKTFHGMEVQFDSQQVDFEDRFNVALQGIGYDRIGEYGAGLEINEYNQIFRREVAPGQWEWYAPSPSIELPYTTTGDWDTEGNSFVSVGDAALRGELASPDGGDYVSIGNISLSQYTTDLYFNSRSGGVPTNGSDVTAALQAVLDDYDRVFIPDGDYLISSPIEVSGNNKEIVFSANANLILNSSVFNDNALLVSGNNNKISLGSVTSINRHKFLVYVTGDDNLIQDGVVFFSEKSTMPPVPGTSIYYNQGGLGLRGNRNTAFRVESYNHEGAGIYFYDNGNKIIECYTHDNCTGVLGAVGSSNASVLNCRIENNDVNNAEAYDGILATTDGLLVSGNLIIGSGEHGTYIHGSNVIITDNDVRGSYYCGIKVGNINNAKVANNSLDGNIQSEQAGEAQIYLQTTFENVVIEGNTTKNTPEGTFSIRATSLNPDDSSVVLNSNSTDGEVAVHVARNSTVAGNIFGGLRFGWGDSSYPMTRFAVASGNQISGTMRIDRNYQAIISNNQLDSILIGGGIQRTVFLGNIIDNQISPITISGFDSVKFNDIYFRQSSGTMFQQATFKHDAVKFQDNTFRTDGARFLEFTSAGISSDLLVITGNTFSGSNDPIVIWGERHLINGNRGQNSIGTLGCNDSIITNNIGAPTMRSGTTGNIVDNNL